MRTGFIRRNQIAGTYESAIFRLPAIWWQRIRFRAQLRADMVDAADLLDDIGINLFDAQAEAMRFFWEPVILTRPPSTSPDVAPEVGGAPGLEMESVGMSMNLQSDMYVRKAASRADIARAARLEAKSEVEVG